MRQLIQIVLFVPVAFFAAIILHFHVQTLRVKYLVMRLRMNWLGKRMMRRL